MITLGLDIGTNSVGSAWVDTGARTIRPGVSVFPAGVDESTQGRGAPKNQARRSKRALRRNLARRGLRKWRLRKLLADRGLLPRDPSEAERLMSLDDPWVLRRAGLDRELAPHEFGRVLVHLNQRRGAIGIETGPDDQDEGRVKEGIDRLREEMANRGARTFGELMAMLRDERAVAIPGAQGRSFRLAIRNRRDSFEFHAERAMIREEFTKLWSRQREFGGELSRMLVPELRRALDDPEGDRTFAHRGALFEQRRLFWNVGTLGRCALEPTDRCAPVADRWASHFRMLASVNDIRLEPRGKSPRALTSDERSKVLDALRRVKSASPATVRRALGVHKGDAKKLTGLNLERDEGRELNTDWFYREIVIGGFGEERWQQLSEAEREGVNRAVLRFDPIRSEDAEALRAGARDWWALSDERAEALVEGWRTRPKLEKRLNLSRRAIQNLLPYMEETKDNGAWNTQIDARVRFAEDADNGATDEQRERYRLGAQSSNRRLRRFLRKHPDLLPPAPEEIANPVVRKAIHEVRRHLQAYLRVYGKRPDRVVIELAREARQSAKVRDSILNLNRRREREIKRIVEDFGLGQLSNRQQRAAAERVVLCRLQRSLCAYTGSVITDQQAAGGEGVEVDHIVPFSRSGDDSLNNKVLCSRGSNRTKGQRTPREWLGDEEFERLLARFVHLRDGDLGSASYFTRRDARRKWENLVREVRPEDEWRNDQLAATAYAARQVGDYLLAALWPEEDRGEAAGARRRVLFTKGKYTAMLRRDWQLIETRAFTDAAGEGGADSGAARTTKYRGDHRHHAIDAVIIALTDGSILQKLARAHADREEALASGAAIERAPVPPPWGTVEEFRREVLVPILGEAVEGKIVTPGLVVSHRPERKLAGPLHEETLFGPVLENGEPSDYATGRISVASLKPAHLRSELGSVGKSGIVRDPGLRAELRRALEARGIDPDNFSQKQLRESIQSAGPLRLGSGVPVHRVVLLRVHRNAIRLTRRHRNPETGRKEPDASPRSLRVYVGGNNHHVEVRQSEASGRLSGKVVDSVSAAARARAGRQLVERSPQAGHRFVMSLHRGETLELRDPGMRTTPVAEKDFYVVAQLNRDGSKVSVELFHHSDGRPKTAPSRSDGSGGADARSLVREQVKLGLSKLIELASPGLTAPRKVRVNPLGEVLPMPGD